LVPLNVPHAATIACVTAGAEMADVGRTHAAIENEVLPTGNDDTRPLRYPVPVRDSAPPFTPTVEKPTPVPEATRL